MSKEKSPDVPVCSIFVEQIEQQQKLLLASIQHVKLDLAQVLSNIEKENETCAISQAIKIDKRLLGKIRMGWQACHNLIIFANQKLISPAIEIRNSYDLAHLGVQLCSWCLHPNVKYFTEEIKKEAFALMAAMGPFYVRSNAHVNEAQPEPARAFCTGSFSYPTVPSNDISVENEKANESESKDCQQMGNSEISEAQSMLEHNEEKENIGSEIVEKEPVHQEETAPEKPSHQDEPAHQEPSNQEEPGHQEPAPQGQHGASDAPSSSSTGTVNDVESHRTKSMKKKDAQSENKDKLSCECSEISKTHRTVKIALKKQKRILRQQKEKLEMVNQEKSSIEEKLEKQDNKKRIEEMSKLRMESKVNTEEIKRLKGLIKKVQMLKMNNELEMLTAKIFQQRETLRENNANADILKNAIAQQTLKNPNITSQMEEIEAEIKGLKTKIDEAPFITESLRNHIEMAKHRILVKPNPPVPVFSSGIENEISDRLARNNLHQPHQPTDFGPNGVHKFLLDGFFEECSSCHSKFLKFDKKTECNCAATV